MRDENALPDTAGLKFPALNQGIHRPHRDGEFTSSGLAVVQHTRAFIRSGLNDTRQG
jgi:hypothetical protein